MARQAGVEWQIRSARCVTDLPRRFKVAATHVFNPAGNRGAGGIPVRRIWGILRASMINQTLHTSALFRRRFNYSRYPSASLSGAKNLPAKTLK
jgi:hypothetical protein